MARRPTRACRAARAARRGRTSRSSAAGYTGLWTALFLRELEPASRRDRARAGPGGLRRKRAQRRHRRRDDRSLARARDRALRPRRGEAAGPDRPGKPRRHGGRFSASGASTRASSVPGSSSWRSEPGTARRSRRGSRRPSASDRPDGGCCRAPRKRRRSWRARSTRARCWRRATGSSTRRLVGRASRGRGRRRACASHESTPVSRASLSGGTASSSHGGGERLARGSAVVAANAWTRTTFSPAAARFLPLYDYILVSDPLTPAQRDGRSAGRPGRGVVDARTFFNYYRLDRRRPDALGNERGRLLPGQPRRRLRATTRRATTPILGRASGGTFPQLAALRFPYRLGRPDRVDDAADARSSGRAAGRALYGLGYTGHGIGSTRIAGRILAHRALERESALFDLAMVQEKAASLSARAVPARGRGPRHARAAPRGCGAACGLILKTLDRLGISFSS